jgi:hypothetical protein
MPAIDVLRLNHSITFLPDRKRRHRHHSPLPMSGSSWANSNGWDGWGRLRDDGPGHYNPDPSDLMMSAARRRLPRGILGYDEQLSDPLHRCCKVHTILFAGYLEVTTSLGNASKTYAARRWHMPIEAFLMLLAVRLRRLGTSLARSALRLPPQRREPSRQASKNEPRPMRRSRLR